MSDRIRQFITLRRLSIIINFYRNNNTLLINISNLTTIRTLNLHMIPFFFLKNYRIFIDLEKQFTRTRARFFKGPEIASAFQSVSCSSRDCTLADKIQVKSRRLLIKS